MKIYKIKYDVDKNGKIITPCPYGALYLISGINCRMCVCFVKDYNPYNIPNEKNIIECSHPLPRPY